MEFFYIVVSIVAVIVLILALTFIGIMINNGKQTQSFPPNTSQCPDLWIPDGSFCHFNGFNNGNYKSYTSGVGKRPAGTHINNIGNFLGDSNNVKGGTYINRYDFSQRKEPGGGSPAIVTNDKYGNYKSAIAEPNYPMNTSPFFTFGGSTNTNSTTINPFDPQWGATGLSADCAKKKWATTNQIEWSGITQLNVC